MDSRKKIPAILNPSAATDEERLAQEINNSIPPSPQKSKKNPSAATSSFASLPDGIRPYSSIPEADVEWLWHPYIPKGKLTILQGDPGVGKTMFVMDLIAHLTQGHPIPFSSMSSSPISVLYITAEDGKEDTIKPRLTRAGADCNKVFDFDEDSIKHLVFEDQFFETLIRATGSELMILDPLAAYVGAHINLNNSSDVRAAFQPLTNIARRTNCAVLLISHMNKLPGLSALYRVSGSIQVSGAVRSVLTLCENRQEDSTCTMVHVKSNLAKKGDAIKLRITDHIEWLDSFPLSPDNALYGYANDISVASTKQAQAEANLKEMLSSGPLPATSILKKLEEKGISKRTSDIAKSNLGITSERRSDGWYWHLPN